MAELEGKNLGPYRVDALLGAGGMGQVYRAHDPRLQREVAIKVLPQALAQEPGYLERFQREARAVAKLNHPNIVSVYDFGEQGGSAYLVMPLIAGGTLRDALAKRGALPLAESIAIIEQVASALQHAHQAGLIHRDVKPANILLTADGRALLSDFGIAKVLDAATALTNTGSSVGSPEYMAPEQTKGEAEYRSDLYALGVVLFQMLTGRPPFRGTAPMQVMLQHLQDAPPAPRLLNPAIPPAVEAVILKAMAKNPNARYQSAAEFVSALKAAANGQAAAATVAAPGASPLSDLPTVGGGPPPISGPPIIPVPSGWASPVPGQQVTPVPPGWATPVAGQQITPVPSGWATPAGGSLVSPPLQPTFGASLTVPHQSPLAAGVPFAPSQPPPSRRRILPLIFVVLALALVIGGGGGLAFAAASGAFKTPSGPQAQQSPGATATTAVTPTTVPSPSPTPMPTFYYMAHIFLAINGDLQNGDTAGNQVGIDGNHYISHEGPHGDFYQMGDALTFGRAAGTAQMIYDSNGHFKFVLLSDRFATYQDAQQYFQRDLTLLQGKMPMQVGEEAAAGIVAEGSRQTYQLFFRDRNVVVTLATVPMDSAPDIADYFLAVAQAVDQRGEHCKYTVSANPQPLSSNPSDCK